MFARGWDKCFPPASNLLRRRVFRWSCRKYFYVTTRGGRKRSGETWSEINFEPLKSENRQPYNSERSVYIYILDGVKGSSGWLSAINSLLHVETSRKICSFPNCQFTTIPNDKTKRSSRTRESKGDSVEDGAIAGSNQYQYQVVHAAVNDRIEVVHL